MYQNSSKVIHSPQDATNTASCVTCAIYLGVGLQKEFWLNTALPATLATLQFDVTQYNNSKLIIPIKLQSQYLTALAAITNTRTIYDNYNTLSDLVENCYGGCFKSYPVIGLLSASFGPGPYGSISFLNENETTAVGPKGIVM